MGGPFLSITYRTENRVCGEGKDDKTYQTAPVKAEYTASTKLAIILPDKPRMAECPHTVSPPL